MRGGVNEWCLFNTCVGFDKDPGNRTSLQHMRGVWERFSFSSFFFLCACVFFPALVLGFFPFLFSFLFLFSCSIVKENSWTITNIIPLRVSLVQVFQTVLFEKVMVLLLDFFFKVKCLVKTIKKCFLKKLNFLLTLIKVLIWVVYYQKEQDIYKKNSLF